MTIIIPIYRLGGHRFNNFCFLIKQLKKVNSDVIVYEQHSNLSVNVERFLSQHKKIKYVCEKLQFDYFNKSILINSAFKKINTEFGWVMDADFYADYSYILNEVATNYKHIDFIRPFSDVVLLDKVETESLYSLNKILLYNTEYTINSEDGKYSFIVRTDTFNECGGLNEDFQGWGFQDLDFVQNRLPHDCLRDNIKKQAFHLYHDTAEKKHATYNRTLFENLGGEVTNSKRNRISSSLVTETVFVNKTTIDHRERVKKQDKTTIQPNTKNDIVVDTKSNKHNWSRPSFGVVCVEYLEDIELLNTNVKKSLVVDEPKLVYSNRGMHKTIVKNGCLLYYIKYILKKYDNMTDNQSVIFANTLFSSKSHDMLELKNKLDDINFQRFEKTNAEFDWIFPTKTKFIHNKQKTTSGCFIIKTDLILKKTKEDYKNLYKKLQKLNFIEQTKLLENIHSFFI